MSQNGNVIVNRKATQSAAAGFSQLGQNQAEEKSFLEQADDALFQLWDGAAGLNFRYASYTIEVLLQGIAQRHINTAQALGETDTDFWFMDEALSDNLKIDETYSSDNESGG